MDELIGRELGQYRIEAKIGEGGMASVFRAYQLSLERYVAVKVLPASFAAKDPTFVKRFRREAKSIAGLHHPNILPVYDFGVERDYSYIVMRYVESAQTLSQVVPQPLSDEQILDLISQIASALTYAHKKGVIHRDVKPGNVLLDGGWALLSDFGLAKVKEAATQLTDSGRSIGTAAYMSPEQAKGSLVDHRTDIYALGIILYEMLTGKIPHDAPTSLAILVKRTTEPPPLPRTINPAISESVEQVILRSLANRPDDRYDSAVDLAGALKLAMRDSAYRERVVGSLDRKTEVISAPHPIVTSDNSKDSFKEKLSKAWHNPAWLAIIGISIVVAAALLLWGGSAFSSAESQVSPTQTVPAVAVASTATNTPLPAPTSTATMTALPTYTPTPVPPTPTEMIGEVQRLPTTTPTATSVPPTPTPTNVPTNTPTLPIASPTATMTPTAAVPEGTMTLLNPLSLDEPSYGPTNFEWQWTGDVPSGFGFEVRVWREGEPPAGVHDAVKDNRSGRIEKIGENRYRLNVDISDAAGVRGRSGQYLWTVGLVQISPNYTYVGYEATPVPLRFEAGGGGGGGNGGDGNSGGGIL